MDYFFAKQRMLNNFEINRFSKRHNNSFSPMRIIAHNFLCFMSSKYTFIVSGWWIVRKIGFCYLQTNWLLKFILIFIFFFNNLFFQNWLCICCVLSHNPPHNILFILHINEIVLSFNWVFFVEGWKTYLFRENQESRFKLISLQNCWILFIGLQGYFWIFQCPSLNNIAFSCLNWFN